jgi:hypothetical protein
MSLDWIFSDLGLDLVFRILLGALAVGLVSAPASSG